jgi:hypothetical protein
MPHNPVHYLKHPVQGLVIREFYKKSKHPVLLLHLPDGSSHYCKRCNRSRVSAVVTSGGRVGGGDIASGNANVPEPGIGEIESGRQRYTL